MKSSINFYFFPHCFRIVPRKRGISLEIPLVFLSLIFCAAGCETCRLQQSKSQQPSNPFASENQIIPPPPTGSYTISDSTYSPPSGAAAFSPTTSTNVTSTIPTSQNSQTSANLPHAASVYGSLPSGAANSAPTILAQAGTETSLPIISRAETSPQNVAARLYNSTDAVSSSGQTTRIVP